ncbi:AAA family ATPase [Bacillus carboniphilus]|uniref:AAA family ATPase n=1 Tax=Bacillus carboniphilus TaxID=86663 RepID=A0ABN0VRE9_9BACI
MNKVHIIGSVGSGKTTLAKKLSKKLDIPYYELDNVVWTRTPNGDIRNSPERRDTILNDIVKTDQWIIEGVHHKWIMPSFKEADLIIFLDTPYSKRIYRIIKRFFLQRLKMESSHYKPTFEIFFKMFKWNRSFEMESKPDILLMLEEYQRKLLVLQNNDLQWIGSNLKVWFPNNEKAKSL